MVRVISQQRPVQFVILVGACLLLGSVVHANEGISDWMHISRDVQGVKIGLDYRVECHTYSLGEACRATPFWINVHGAQPGSSVRAVFINHSQDGNREIREIDLRFDGLKHTAEVTDGTRTRINGGRQELAVVINGVWSTRYTGGRNFSIDLMNGR